MKTLQYYYLIPEKILQKLPEIEDFLKKQVKRYSAESLKEVISIIACHVRKKSGNAQVQMKYVIKLVPQGNKYIQALLKYHVIGRAGGYKPGKKSFQYNFLPEFWSKYISLPIVDPNLIKRIEKLQRPSRKNVCLSTKGYSQQVKYLKSLSFKEGYKEFITTNYSGDLNRYNSFYSSVTRILNHDFSFSVDNTSGRFHSNITNMPKELRKFLIIKNESLTNIDIKNCQPYLAIIFLTNPSKIARMAKSKSLVDQLNSMKVTSTQDIQRYIELVVMGGLYEYLMNEFLKEGLNLSREETKKQILRILFARNRNPKNETNLMCRQIFANRFPTVHGIFSKIRGSAKGDKFSNYKRFSILLQRIESYLILDVILKRIYKEHPGTIAMTIHDSIMTGIRTNSVEVVKNIMNEELTKFVGFPPQIKIEQ